VKAAKTRADWSLNATRVAFLLLPLAGILVVDRVPFDFHAAKYFALALVSASARYLAA